jgi:four helix bundle protein
LIQFIGIARGSTLEVQTQLELASMLGMGKVENLIASQNLANEIIRILNATLLTLREQSAAKHKKAGR